MQLSVSISAIAYYTKTQAVFMDVVSYGSALSTDADLSKRISTHTNQPRAKEFTGIERAIGANAFSAGKFPTFADFTKFVGVVSTQDTYLTVFFAFAPPEQRALHESTLEGRAIDETAQMRQVALSSVETQSLGGGWRVGTGGGAALS